MSDEGVLSEFDPLAASKQSKSMSTQPTIPKEKETSTSEVSSKAGILDEFDPLTQQREADKEPAASVHVSQSTMTSSALQSNSTISPAKSTQPHTSSYEPQRLVDINGSSKDLQSSHKMDKSGIRKGDKATGVSQSTSSEASKSDRIGAEISQIDSVLKALNMGQFDLATMSSFTGTTATPQSQEKPQSSQPKQAEAMPAAVRSTGLSLIGQLGSGDSGSSSESEDSSSDSSDDSMGLARELRRGNRSGSGEEGEPTGGRKQRLPMSKGEVDYRTLPAPKRCDIPFPESGTIMPMGKVSHLAEKLVVIQALPGTPPFDEGTVIWTKDKKSIAKIFETFGPVKSPLYSVLVESVDHASSLGLTPGQLVYVVPSNMELSRYIFTRQLIKQKGSDASWKDDNEVPPQFQDYSDDESEQTANKVKKQGGKRARQSATGANPQQQQQQHDMSAHNPVPGAPQPQPQPHTYTPPYQHHSLNPLQPGIPVPPTSSGYAYYSQQGGYNTGSKATYSNYNMYSGYQAPYPPPH